MKRVTTIMALVLSVIITIVLVIGSTYSVIINVINNDNGESEIINQIRIRDILTNDNGEYNNTYYQVKNELNITYEEADLLMESESLNRGLQVVLNSIVSYKLHNKNKLNNNELINLIIDSINEDNNISDELKDKVINKSRIYISDISKYMYDIEVLSNGEDV